MIETERIDVSDTDYLLTICTEADDAAEDDVEELAEDSVALDDPLMATIEEPAPWLPQGPSKETVRFRISVTLKCAWSIP